MTSKFDLEAMGLLTHYSPDAQGRIRRLMLEDWLAKLSHQTMDKMLKNISTPRHEFWACLHLYLIKKYGLLEIDPQQISEADILGQAMARFGQLEDAPQPATIEVDAVTRLEINEATRTGFAPANLTQTRTGPPPLNLEIEEIAQGIAVCQGEGIKAILREDSTLDLRFVDVLP